MKRGTPGHKKMHHLAQVLGVPLPMAVGIMEMLWHYAAQHAPEGDIGGLPDSAISAAVYWTGQPADLIDGLVEANWLHRHETHRLYIHDWPQHCEQSVGRWLTRNSKCFLEVYNSDYNVASQRLVSDSSVTSKKLASREATATAESSEIEIQESGSAVSNYSNDSTAATSKSTKSPTSAIFAPSSGVQSPPCDSAPQRSVSEVWSAAGFPDGPEEFEGWWVAFLGGYPNPHRNAVGRAKALDDVLVGFLLRARVESGFEAHRARWLDEPGFESNIGDFFVDRLYMHPPRPKPRKKQTREQQIREAILRC